jgi:MraZ protein
MLVKGFDACLYLYPEDGWKDFAAKHIDSRPMEAEDASDLQFFFYSNSQVLEPDTQGRIILPQSFIDYAGIRKEMVNIGFGDHVQIWSREGYEARMDRVQQNPRGLLRGMLKYEQQS